MSITAPSDDAKKELRAKFYNASITRFDRVHSELAIFRVLPDGGPLRFNAGQYTVLGLGYWEPRLPDTQCEVAEEIDWARLVKRAYSISCPLLDETGKLVRVSDGDELEFYVALVRYAEQPPALTPRLFKLSEGDRIFLASRCHGTYGIHPLHGDETIVFLATGTGEAPHNAMLAELVAKKHKGTIVSVVCTRLR